MQCCAEKCFFPAVYCTLDTATVLIHREPRTMQWHCCYYPNAQGAGWGHRSIPERTTRWPGCGRGQFTPLSQQPWDGRVLGLGSPHWSLDFAGDVALCSAEPLLLDVKPLQRKGHNLIELAHCSTKFQALVICKPSHDSSSVHEGRDSFPVKVPDNNHKPKKPLHGYESQRDQAGYFHCLRRAGGKQHFDYQSSSLGTGRGVFRSAGWPGKHN